MPPVMARDGAQCADSDDSETGAGKFPHSRGAAGAASICGLRQEPSTSIANAGSTAKGTFLI